MGGIAGDYKGLLDMIDGGGAGQSGDEFEGGGMLSMLANLLATPRGAGQQQAQAAPQTRISARNAPPAPQAQPVPNQHMMPGVGMPTNPLKMPGGSFPGQPPMPMPGAAPVQMPASVPNTPAKMPPIYIPHTPQQQQDALLRTPTLSPEEQAQRALIEALGLKLGVN